MTFADPAGWWLLLLAIPIVALHMLRPRRPPVEVSSTFLWQQVARPVSSATPWQRLRPSVLLLLQLLAVILLAGAVARPVRPTSAPLSRHTVFVVDTAGSMAAIDGHPDRIGSAKSKAIALRRQLPAGGVASIVVASSQPQVVLSASPDGAAFRRAVDGIQVEAGTPDYATAFSLAEGLETPGVPVGFVFLSDGELTSAEAGLIPPGTDYVEVGSRATNRAITALLVDPKGSGLHTTVTLRNLGGPSATQPLRFDVDGRTVSTVTVSLPAGATVTKAVDLPGGDRVDVYLEGEDLLAADNHAYAVAARRRPLKVLLAGPPATVAASAGASATPAPAAPASAAAPAAAPAPAPATPAPAGAPAPPDLFVQRFLAASPGVTTVTSATSTPAPGYDLVIYDQVAVPADPGAPFLAIDPPGGIPGGGVTVTGSVNQPAVTLVKGSDPLLTNLDLSSVAIAKAQQLSAPTDDVLVGAEGAPLLVRGTDAGRPYVYLGFALADSNLGVQVAWPLLADRLLTSLTGAAVPPSNLVVGQPLPLGDDHPAMTISGPAGIAFAVAADAPAPVASMPGFWSVHSGGHADVTFAVNADPRQSDLAPAGSLPIRPRPPLPGERAPAGQTSLLRYVVLALLVVLAAELYLEWRARAAPHRQWQAALALRGAMVASLIASLLALTLPRVENRVAVVFLIDQSDSMGTSGRAQATTWVRDAIGHEGRSDLAGVVVFGAGAKVDLTVQHNPPFLEPSTTIDSSQTDLAQALRLGGALLPATARRRIVVVSDGRANTGDADAEAADLRAEGVRVDYHAVTATAGPDVAVTGMQAPTVARPGDLFPIQATLNATIAETVGLTLSRDGAVVDQRTVAVKPGDTVVEIPQTVAADASSAIVSYRLDVSAPNDSVPENNVGFAAVTVVGPATVLVVEGMPGEAATLTSALQAGGLHVTTVSPANLPTVDRLAAYDATVLVDVDDNQLAPEQTAALKVATEDLGKGLVVLGGDRSYGLGGYLSSDLEQLLPVVSDVTDPKRQLSVAEVLAIDSSGSMAACHCNGGATVAGGQGARTGGGVNKTDISKTAAARAIAALNANDQVGVLAFNTEDRWIVPLQNLPPADVVTKGLGSLTPAGGTDLTQPLPKAAAALQATKAQLKHIILFTDGFTSTDALNGLAQQAAQLFAEGITVSVLATGEGATAQLQAVADAGHGRFYADQDLSQVPTIMAQEAVLATRNLVVEGSFYPKVVSSAAPVRSLTASPPLLGYLATTAKPTAQTLLTIGDQGDPLLASWQAGLGKVTSWTSDASARWSPQWATWAGYVGFWTGVVKDAFPLQGSGGDVQAVTVGNQLRVTVESPQAWPDGATAQARVADPSLTDQTVTLQQTSATTFVGQIPATGAGTYAVGVTVSGPGGALFSGTAVAERSYSAEYLPGQPDPAALARVSRLSGGRGAIAAAQAFRPAGLPAGRGLVPLTGWFLLAAALLWPLVVALGRVALHGAVGKKGAWRSLRRFVPFGRGAPALPAGARRAPTTTVSPPAADDDALEEVLPADSLSRLLQRKREGRQKGR